MITRYKCGIARQFEDPETGEQYSERWMTCNWNKTWTKTDTLDECVWTQCINPPEVANRYPVYVQSFIIFSLTIHLFGA